VRQAVLLLAGPAQGPPVLTDQPAWGRNLVRHPDRHRRCALAGREAGPRIFPDPEIDAGIESGSRPVLGWHALAERWQVRLLPLFADRLLGPVPRGGRGTSSLLQLRGCVRRLFSG
jgi:hypothetical protein